MVGRGRVERGGRWWGRPRDGHADGEEGWGMGHAGSEEGRGMGRESDGAREGFSPGVPFGTSRCYFSYEKYRLATFSCGTDKLLPAKRTGFLEFIPVEIRPAEIL